jgi:hypothetical protein
VGTPHANGKDATLIFFIDGTPASEFDVKSWEVQRNATDIADGVCGEDRDRLDSITNFYSIDIDCFSRTAKLLDAFLAEQDNDDANAAPTNKTVSLILKPRDGSKKGYNASEVSLGGWRFGAGGRSDRVMTKVPLRARYFKSVTL